MTARNRVVAAAGLLVVLFLAGVVWLVVRAAGESGPESTALDPLERSAGLDTTTAAPTGQPTDPQVDIDVAQTEGPTASPTYSPTGSPTAAPTTESTS